MCIFYTNSSRLIVIIVYVTNGCSQLQAIVSKSKVGNLKAHNYTIKSLNKMTLSDHERYDSDIL